jgi:DNA-binding NarL/FixJ family response regulator
MKDTIKIILVDDQVLFREGLRTLLSVESEFEVVAEAENGEQAVRLATQHRPNIILMDIRMPIMDGVAATKRIMQILPDTRIIVLTTFDDDELVFDGLRAGAVGYLLKDVSSDKLFEAIRTTNRGEYFMLPSITSKVMAEFSRLSKPKERDFEELIEPLSQREIEILSIAATGASNREIAEQLFIAEGTVKNHMSNILNKMSVRDRMQAVMKGKDLGII